MEDVLFKVTYTVFMTKSIFTSVSISSNRSPMGHELESSVN